MKLTYTLKELKKTRTHVFSGDGKTAFVVVKNQDEEQAKRNSHILLVLKERGLFWVYVASICPKEATRSINSFGSSLRTNNNGTIVAIAGRSYNNEGRVWIYEDATPPSLTQMGQAGTFWQCEVALRSPVLDRINTSTQFGTSLAMNKEGTTLYVTSYTECEKEPFVTLYSFKEGLNSWLLKSYNQIAVSMEVPLFDMDTNADGSLIVLGATAATDNKSFFVVKAVDGDLTTLDLVHNETYSTSGYTVCMDKISSEIVATPYYAEKPMVEVSKFIFHEGYWLLSETEKQNTKAGSRTYRFAEYPDTPNYHLHTLYLNPKDNNNV